MHSPVSHTLSVAGFIRCVLVQAIWLHTSPGRTAMQTLSVQAVRKRMSLSSMPSFTAQPRSMPASPISQEWKTLAPTPHSGHQSHSSGVLPSISLLPAWVFHQPCSAYASVPSLLSQTRGPALAHQPPQLGQGLLGILLKLPCLVRLQGISPYVCDFSLSILFFLWQWMNKMLRD